jgi:hypothetical protein
LAGRLDRSVDRRIMTTIDALPGGHSRGAMVKKRFDSRDILILRAFGGP